jgi:hypothetical protein
MEDFRRSTLCILSFCNVRFSNALIAVDHLLY